MMIRRVVDKVLKKITEEDIKQNRPLVASTVEGIGDWFFEMAKEAGRMGEHETREAFLQREREDAKRYHG